MYFDGELKPIKLRWSTSRHNLGLVRVRERGTGKDKTVEVVDLAISKVYDMTREQFYDTFIHECIHVWMYQNYNKFNWLGGAHGYEFEHKARELSQKSGVTVSVKHDHNLSQLIANEKHVKPFHLVAEFDNGQWTGRFAPTMSLRYRNGFDDDLKVDLDLRGSGTEWRMYTNIKDTTLFGLLGKFSRKVEAFYRSSGTTQKELAKFFRETTPDEIYTSKKHDWLK